MYSCKKKYVKARKLLKAIDILPARMQDSSLSEWDRANLQRLLEILQMQKHVIEAHQKAFPDGDRNYPIPLNNTQYRFLIDI
jgi:hypothetical protein